MGKTKMTARKKARILELLINTSKGRFIAVTIINTPNTVNIFFLLKLS